MSQPTTTSHNLTATDQRPEPAAPTPGQTVGPFFGYSLPYEGGPNLVDPHDARAVTLHGVLYDGAGNPVPDGLIEIWQRDEHGRIVAEPGSLVRDHRTFTGFGRSATDADGRFWFFTVMPGRNQDRPGVAPFIAMAVFARGLLDKLHTRVYLPRYAALNGTDPFLSSLSPQERATLTATADTGGADDSLRFDVYLQGDRETVFLDFG
jgi:protocatechuate 3,4-dioxygenase alpha subunit